MAVRQIPETEVRRLKDVKKYFVRQYRRDVFDIIGLCLYRILFTVGQCMGGNGVF